MRRGACLRKAVLSLLCVCLLAGCSREEPVEAGLARVDPSLAPTSVVRNTLQVRPNTSRETQLAFANAGPDSLLVDGRLWEIRRADKLIATIQIGTLRPRVQVEKEDVRRGIVGQILTGKVSSIRVDGLEIYFATSRDKTVYVWFGRGLFEVLQIKSKTPKPEEILRGILEHQRTVPAWRPLTVSSGSS
jgi:hypothetical protein